MNSTQTETVMKSLIKYSEKTVHTIKSTNLPRIISSLYTIFLTLKFSIYFQSITIQIMMKTAKQMILQIILNHPKGE